MTQRSLSVLLLALGFAWGIPAYAVNGSSIEVGSGDDSTKQVRVGLRWNWDKRWSIGQSWNATGFWESQPGLLGWRRRRRQEPLGHRHHPRSSV
jgi:hypothetical protein